MGKVGEEVLFMFLGEASIYKNVIKGYKEPSNIIL
jgi:hypothetical protein